MKKIQKLLTSVCLALICAFCCVGFVGCNKKQEEQPQAPVETPAETPGQSPEQPPQQQPEQNPQQPDLANFAVLQPYELLIQALTNFGTIDYVATVEQKSFEQGEVSQYFGAQEVVIYNENGTSTKYIKATDQYGAKQYEGFENVMMRDIEVDYEVYGDATFDFDLTREMQWVHGTIELKRIPYFFVNRVWSFLIGSELIEMEKTADGTEIEIVGNNGEISITITLNEFNHITSCVGYLLENEGIIFTFTETFTYTNVEFPVEVPTEFFEAREE